jgi:hypothetical protein
LDELGPLAVKTYPGAEWVVNRSRATFKPDYGGRGSVWVHGAFEPATGQAALVVSGKRDSASHIQLLEKAFHTFPAERLLVEFNRILVEAVQVFSPQGMRIRNPG